MIYILRLLWNIIMRSFLKFYVRLSFKNIHNLPKNQRYIIVSNHSSHLDALCLVAAVPLTKVDATYVAAAKDCFFKSSWKAILFQFVINALPFDREHNSFQSLELCAKKISGTRNILVYFPEGTRSLNGDIQPFKSGIGVLATSSEVLIVPAWIEGSHQAWPKISWFPLPYKVNVIFGKPMSFAGMPKTRESYSLIAKELEQNVLKLKEN